MPLSASETRLRPAKNARWNNSSVVPQHGISLRDKTAIRKNAHGAMGNEMRSLKIPKYPDFPDFGRRTFIRMNNKDFIARPKCRPHAVAGNIGDKRGAAAAGKIR